MLLKEEYALGMEQRSSDAARKVAQINLKMEECASGMEQKRGMLCGSRRSYRPLTEKW